MVGLVSTLLVLRTRRVWSVRAVVAVALAGCATQIGAKLQYHLEDLPFQDAFLVTFGDLYGPGWRLPLGLMAGFVTATLACVLLRIPLRPVADALAVGATTMIAIGRFGCLAAGCCMGVPCHPWLWHICRRFGPGTLVYANHVGLGLIPPGAPLSLPVHLLPVYFSLVALSTLGILLRLLSKDVASGVMFAVGCVTMTATTIVLETVRASPVAGPKGLQLLIPAGALLIGVGFACDGARRRSRLPGTFVTSGPACHVDAPAPRAP